MDTTTAKATPRPRIDKLTPGTLVSLDFAGKHTEPAFYLGVTGTGNDRLAHFMQTQLNYTPKDDEPTAKPFVWQAYRFNGGWVFGSSAERLSLAAVLHAA